MSHLTDEQLSALADGALEGGSKAAAERHLEACGECREALAGLVARDRALSSALEHDPGEDYFRSFAGRVGGRIRAAGLAGAQAREPEGRSLADWFRAPRKLALVGAVATVVAGAGIAMLATREVRVPSLREQKIEGRVAQEAPPAPAPPGVRPEGQPGTPRETPSGTRGAPPLALEPAAPLPAAGLAKGTARSRADSRATTSAGSGAGPAAPAREQRPTTNRAQEVRRNQAGEDVPVRSYDFLSGPPRAAPAPPAAPSGSPVRVQKPRYAESLSSERQTDALRAGAQPADKDAPVAVAKAAPEAESKPMAAQRAGADVAARKELTAPGRLLGLADRGPALQVRGTPEAFDGLPTQPRTLAKNAQRLTALAEEMDVAPAWDSAAAEWERVIEGVQGGALESETRFQVARARFMAWQRGASQKRVTRAAQALRSFLAHAPQGAERDSAQAWLARSRK